MNGIDRLFGTMRIASSAMSAERVRMDVISKNIANAGVTETGSGEPYRRRMVEFAPLLRQTLDGRVENDGIHVKAIHEDNETPMERIRMPGHQHADPDGFVTLPNVNSVLEMADMITAMRSYEANLSVQESFVQMAQRALRAAQV